mgnify:CR=1 FL=1
MSKRRSRKQSKSRGVNPLVVVLVAGGVLLIVMVIGLLVIKSTIGAWLKGDEFRQFLVQKAGVVMGSEIELADMTWQGSEAYAERFRARGYNGASFSEIGLDGIRAQSGGISDGAFRVPEVTVNRFQLLFSDRRIKRPPGEDAVVTQEFEGPEIPEWLSRFVPNRIEVDEVAISSATVSVENDDGTTSFELSGVKAKIRPDFQAKMWEIGGQGGKLQVADQPVVKLKDLAMRWQETDIFIDRCALGIYEAGHIDGTGEISFSGEGNFDLDLQISSIDVDELIEGEWRDRLSGIVEGPVRISGPPEALIYEGTLNVIDAVVEEIPVLTVISKYTRNEQFKYLVLSKAQTEFKSNGELIELRDLVLQADGLVRVEGDVDIQGEAIAGALQVGVTAGTLRWIPGAERQVFVESRDGFLWAPLNLTGTISEPKEDLSGRLIAAAGEAILKELPEGLLNEAQKFLNPRDGASDSDDLQERGKSVIDILSPFLKGL